MTLSRIQKFISILNEAERGHFIKASTLTRIKVFKLRFFMIFLGVIILTLQLRYYSQIPIILVTMKRSKSNAQIQSIEVKNSSTDSAKYSSVMDNNSDILPHTIQKYVRWHSEMYKCIEAGNCTSYPNVLLWRCLDGQSTKCGGIGDRLRGIQFSFLLSIVTNRMFFIDWPNYPFDFTQAIIPYLINWKLPPRMDFENWAVLTHSKWPDLTLVRFPTTIERSNGSTRFLNDINKYPRNIDMRKANITSLLAGTANLTISTSSTLQSIARVVHNNALMTPFLDIHPRIYGMNNLYRKLLQPLFRPSNLVSNGMREETFIGIHKEPYIAVHIRTGADVGESNHRRFQSHPNDTVMAKNLLDCIQRINDDKKWAVFFASDSISLKREVLEKSKIRNIRVLTKTIPADHFGRPRGPYKVSEYIRWVAFVNVYVEFFGIAGAERIIGNESGFSRMAYFVGNASDYIRFLPRGERKESCQRVTNMR